MRLIKAKMSAAGQVGDYEEAEQDGRHDNAVDRWTACHVVPVFRLRADG